MPGKYFYRCLDEKESIFQPSDYTIGPWSRKLQHGGPPFALCVRQLEKFSAAEISFASSGNFVLPHIVARFFRAVPVKPVKVTTRVLHKGKSQAHVEASLYDADSGKELFRATAVVLRKDSTGLEDLPKPPAGALVPEMTLPNPKEWVKGNVEGFSDKFSQDSEELSYSAAFRFNRVSGEFTKGPTSVWTGQLVATVQGDENANATTPLQKMAAICDSCNGFSFYVDPMDYGFMNTDVTLHVLNSNPQGQEIGLQSRAVYNGRQGTGMTSGELFDSHDGSHVATVHQSLLLQSRM